MSLRLKPPRPGKSPNFTIRGTHLGVYVDQSARTSDRRLAQQQIKVIKDQIERGAFARPVEQTLAGAALTYMEGGGSRRFIAPLIRHFGEKPLSEITQEAIDGAAISIYPRATPATRNRQVHTPISAILRSAGIKAGLSRPKGARGKSRLAWLRPEEVYGLLQAANSIDPEFSTFLTLLVYTGVRLTEALNLIAKDVDLSEGIAYVRTTKNGEPRTVHLPPVVVAAIANCPARSTDGRQFRFRKNSSLYGLLDKAAARAGVMIPERVAFHICRHTYGAWMRRYGGLDTSGLVATGAWKSRQAAAVYEHVETTEEARKADRLPVAKR